MNTGLKAGIYVDNSYVISNGGYGMDYEKLKDFVCRQGRLPVRLNTYMAFDQERATEDYNYKRNSEDFHTILRELGFKVVIKYVKKFSDENNNIFVKSNADLDLAVDMLLQAQNLDVIVLVSGDGDFLRVVRAVQNLGCRVELIGFDNIANDLKKEVDYFTSGYLVRDLLPIKSNSKNLMVRGTCYNYKQDKGYGFFKVMRHYEGNLHTQIPQDNDSSYVSIYFKKEEFKHDYDFSYLPNRRDIFEFEIVEHIDKQGNSSWTAKNILKLNRKK